MEKSLDRQRIYRIYESLDKDGDGLLNAAEINGFLHRLGMESVPVKKLSDIFVSFKENGEQGSSSLNFEEFVAFCQSLWPDENMDSDDETRLLRDVFSVYDKNEDGFISPEELQRVLCSLGFSEGRQISDCQTMICRFDRNSDGLLDFSEFKSMMTFRVSV